jgi:predicted transcriptional regulator
LIDHLEPSMSTTTIRIDEELKARVAMAAQRAGKTAHAFIVEAIARTVEQVEWDEAFERLADDRWTSLMTNERSVAWSDTKAWLEARARGVQSPRPSARKLKR